MSKTHICATIANIILNNVVITTKINCNHCSISPLVRSLPTTDQSTQLNSIGN